MRRMDNNSEPLSIIPFCSEEDSDICLGVAWESGLSLSGITTMVLNIIHLLILIKLTDVKGTLFFKINIHLTIGNIFPAMLYLSLFSCKIRHHILQHSSVAFIFTTFQFTAYIRYVLLAIAALERALALVMPLRYKSLCIVQHMNKIMIASWTVIPASMLSHSLIFSDRICMDKIFGPISKEWIGMTVITVLYNMIPTLIMLVSVLKILTELYKLSKRRIHATAPQSIQVTWVDKNNIRHAIIITVVILIYLILCTFPVGIYTILAIAFQISNPDEFWLAEYLLHSIYGISNPLTYILLSRAYRARMVDIITSAYQSMWEQIRTKI